MSKRLHNHFIPHEDNNYKPHFVRVKSLASIALFSVVLFGLAFSLKSLVTRYPDLLSAVITGVMVDITNADRLNQNLRPLEVNPVLAAAAQLKANDMAGKGYFAHTSPEGKTPWYWFTTSGYRFLYAGENLAVNFVDSEDVVRAWMNSQGHRANILNDKFTEIGIAIASGTYNNRESIYVVQLFGRPVSKVARQKLVVINESEPAPIVKSGTGISGAEATAENVDVLAENKMFIAVQNNDYTDAGDSLPANTDLVAQSSILGRTLASPKMALEAIYLFIGSIVFFALVLFVWMKPKRLHIKNVVYTILLLALVVTLFCISSIFLYPQILIE